MHGHRLQRGVIEAAKRCKADADKTSCLSKGTKRGKASELEGAYDAIAKTFTKFDDELKSQVRFEKLKGRPFVKCIHLPRRYRHFLQSRCEMLERYASSSEEAAILEEPA